MSGLSDKKLIRRRQSSRIVFLSLLIVSVLIFLLDQSNSRFMNGLKARAESIVVPTLSYITMPVRGFETAVGDVGARNKAHEENIRLKAELARLSEVEAKANAMEVRLARFETMLNIDDTQTVPEIKVAARAVSEVNGPFAKSTLINAGAKKGLAEGYAVMTSDGLLGHIVRVGNNSARVLNLEDLNSRIPVMSMRSGARAILAGDNSDTPKLSYVADEEAWHVGDRVVTSGDDGILPQGLPVGVVEDIGKAVIVTLHVKANPVDWVWVYPYEKTLPPEDSPVEDESADASDNVQTDDAP